MKAWHVALAVGMLFSAWAIAQEDEPEASEQERIVGQLEQLGQQLAVAQGVQAAALQQQIERLRVRLEELERDGMFEDIRSRERDRVWDLEAEITELRERLAAEEGLMPQVHRNLLEARLAYLREVLSLSRQVANLPGAEELPKAFDLLARMETLEMKWQIVDTPKLEGAARIFDMTRAAAELDNPPELMTAIEQTTQQRTALVADAENLFQIWMKHRQMRQEYEQVMDGFWQKFEQAHAGRQALP